MRCRRTSRKSLKNELDRLTRENEALAARLQAAPPAAPLPSPHLPSAPPPPTGESAPSAPVLMSGGYPTRSVARTAKSLKEAKEILLSSTNW